MERGNRNHDNGNEEHENRAFLWCPTRGCGKKLPLREVHMTGWCTLYCRYCGKEVRIEIGQSA